MRQRGYTLAAFTKREEGTFFLGHEPAPHVQYAHYISKITPRPHLRCITISEEGDKLYRYRQSTIKLTICGQKIQKADPKRPLQVDGGYTYSATVYATSSSPTRREAILLKNMLRNEGFTLREESCLS